MSSAALAPPARIVRRTGAQLAQLGRRDATVAAWRALAHEACEAQARQAVAERLPLLAARLWRSPYWCRELRAAGLSPADLATLADLEAFPGLDRDALARAGDELVALAADDAPVVVLSSGTSGAPVRVVKDHWDSLVMWAALAWWCEGFAVTLPARPRVVLLDSLPGGMEYSVRARLVGDGGGALHRISVARGGARAAARLARIRPAVVFSDPDGLHWWTGAGVAPPLMLLTSAQWFAPTARAALPAVPIVNYYATTETGPIAWECARAAGRFHVLAPEVWVESVAGELVVTRLRDSVLPLLRYRTGDAGRVEREPGGCAGCGFQGWSIVDFGGRRACAFVRPDGQAVDAWTLAWVFKHHALRSFRLVQLLPEAFQLRVDGVPDAHALAEMLRAALVRQGWRAASLRLEVVVAPLSDAAGAVKPAPFACECGAAAGAPATAR